MRRGGFWVSSSAWYEKSMVWILCKNALRVFREIKERACVHRLYLAKPLGLSQNMLHLLMSKSNEFLLGRREQIPATG